MRKDHKPYALKRLQGFIEQQQWQQFWLVNPGPTPLAPGRNQHRFFSSKISHWQPPSLTRMARQRTMIIDIRAYEISGRWYS